MTAIKLGLIGDNIALSRAPALHRLAGGIAGLQVSYDLLIPAERNLDFDALFAWAAGAGYRGLNITLPYKERVVPKVLIEDPLARSIAAINTVVFDPAGGRPSGYNTDHSGFIQAFRGQMGAQSPGVVVQIGAGGVGKAIAFGLIVLGATAIRLVEIDRDKAERLAAALRLAAPGLPVTVSGDAAAAALGATGILNCTPLGMGGYGGTPLPAASLEAAAKAGAQWAFDAVYTPRDTAFLRAAAAAGLAAISGYELFFFQGVDAFRRFTGRAVDEARLRAALYHIDSVQIIQS